MPLITGVIVALCGGLYWQTGELRARQNWIQHSYEVKLQIEELDRTLREAESVQRAILLTRQSEGELQASFSSLLVSVSDHSHKLEDLVADNAAQARLTKELSVLLKERVAILVSNATDLINLRRSERSERILKGITATNAFEIQLGKIRDSEKLLLDRRTEEARVASSRLLTLAIGGSALGLAVLLLAVVQERRNRRIRDRYLNRLAEARDTALDAVHATSTFVATVSHEIRTPMNGVLGAADLLRQDSRLDRRQRELVETIHYSGEALLDLINDILDLSKLQAGKMDFSSEEFSLAQVLEECMALFADSASRKRLELAHRVAPEVPQRFKGDPLRLRQVLLNLVGNAVKFTEHGSVVVDVTCRNGEDGRPVLRFRVTDTGPGIAPEEQGRLFLPFGQVNAALSRRHAGTGLGLAISMEIAQRLGGTIGVESKPGSGSAFWFTARLENAAETAAGDERLCRGGSLILLEGRELTAGTIKQHVLAWGMKVHIVPSLQALRALPEIADLAVVVVGQVADASWKELMGRISKRRDARKIPKFLLSQMHEQPQEHELAAGGIQACLRFPFRPSDLYNLLADDRHEPSADAAPESALPHARILLVEDNHINQRVFGRQLEMLGMDMIICGDGLEGVEARIAGGIDLIMMDCQLPTIDGFEATRRIRNWELKTGAKRLPVIAVTAHVMSGDAEACFQAGMDDYLPKPFDLVKLRRKLGQWLPHGEQQLEEESVGKEPLIIRTLDSEQLGDCLTGNAEIDQELIGAALEELGLRCGEVEKALRQNDDATWRSSAHQAVGTAATMGFVELAEHFRQAEAAAEWPQREWIFSKLGPVTEKTRQALTALGLVEGGILVGMES